MTTILVTGGTGYIGSRLIQALGSSNYQLVCTARNPSYLESRIPDNAVVKSADFSKKSTLKGLFEGVDVAFFLMHSLGEKKGFEEHEFKVAQNFVDECILHGVKRIIYLGGLVEEGHRDLSPHMRSRTKVGKILRESGIPTIEFRAQ